MHHLPCRRPVVVCRAVDPAVFLRAAVPPVASVRAVEPHLEHLAVSGEQFLDLLAEHLDVLRIPVERGVAVPRRAVDSGPQALTTRGVYRVAHHVALPALVRRLRDVVLRRLRGPQAESVVVLRDKDYAVYSGVLRLAHHEIEVDVSRIELRGVLSAEAPFLVRERVDAEVDDGDYVHLVARELARARHGAPRTLVRGRRHQRGYGGGRTRRRDRGKQH